MSKGKIIEFLFAASAIEVCEAGKPFFYTSGKFGPYYINTHYLYGSKQDAEKLLDIMDKATENKRLLPLILKNMIMDQYAENEIFRNVIDILTKEASVIDIDYISGGERRDFFFSIPVAVMTGKPHLSIFKDGSVYYSTDDFQNTLSENEFSISGTKALHIADLVTEASSYSRAWIPAVRRLESEISDSLAVVDRNQGGADVLRDDDIGFKALAVITDDFFQTAVEAGFISEDQLGMIKAFTADPDKFILDFLESDPGFLDRQIAAGGKAKERALRCIEQGFDKRVIRSDP